MKYDVVIVGGGPAGLAAALALGRARKRVLLTDQGPRRNAAARNVHNFLTRDGTPPAELRRIAEEQLMAYPNVEVRHEAVASIAGTRGDFRIEVASGTVVARRIVVSTGLVDDVLPIEGFQEAWGRSIFQCPYCHGWETQGGRWGYLARDADALLFAIKLRSWTRNVVALTSDSFDVPPPLREKLAAAGVVLERRGLTRLVSHDGQLTRIELADGTSIECDVLFAHPPQRQVEIVRHLGLAVEPDGFLRVDPLTRETSIRGIYACGDLTSRLQGAIFAAAAGAQAAAALNAELTAELASTGAL